MRVARAALACAVVVAVGVVLVSGGSDGGPRTPPALPGLPPPFLGTAVTGGGGMTAAVDAYGDVVDLRAPGPAGAALIDNSSTRQAAGTVPADTGIVPRVRRIGDGPAEPMWRADSVTQRYVAGTDVVRTVARFSGDRGTRVVMTVAAVGESLAVVVRTDAKGQTRGVPSISADTTGGDRCARERRAGQLHLLCGVGGAVPPFSGAAAGGRITRACAGVIRSAVGGDRHWLGQSRPLGADAPAWARSMYRRSLLTIRALTSRRTGAVAAGARDGWAYVWPRDAATAALALEASGHPAEARAVAHFLTGLDLAAAARFDETGVPVPGRAAQGDATGWVDAAAAATDIPAPRRHLPWRDRADYQESSPGTYLGNAIAAAALNVAREFGTPRGLVRSAEDPGSGLDSAAGWAVRPFGLRSLYPRAERTLLQLLRQGTRFGITPGEGWEGGEDPWTAPTAWSAWAFAALSQPGGSGPRPNLHAVREGEAHSRRAALALLADLRRASTPAGDLPERVGVRTGIPTSTTPLLWSSAFAVLALRELWP
ncbi:MAG TPA: hypothetical protein VHV53_01680 [Solirubrobacterales bacterium]|nr:hypothetical protein [Solirubrobacterales bacterium]